MAHTYASLAKSDNRALDRVMDAGRAPTIAELLGFEFRGWNVNAFTRVIGTRKFKKGIFGDPGENHGWGYNVKVRQNDFDEPWQSTPSEQDPERYAYFKVFPSSAAKKPIYRNSLVIDYHASGEYLPIDPVGYTVDYLVYPNLDDNNLILGKSYLENGFFRPFLGYFILDRIPEPPGFDRTTHALNAEELRTVRAFAEVFIEGEDEQLTPAQISFNIDRYLSRVSSSRRDSLRAVLFLIEHLLPRKYGLPFRKPFSKMSPAERKQFIQQGLVDPSNRGLLRDLSRIRALFVAGYYSDTRVYQRLGFEPVEQRPGRENIAVLDRPDTRIQIHEPEGTDITCDVCVIGSGAGGAVVAWNCASQGKDVVLLEEGAYVTPDQITHSEQDMIAKLYKEGGLQTTVDLDMVILQGKLLGGTTYINNAICYRIGDPTLSPGQRDLLGEWDQLGAHVDRAALATAYGRVEQQLGIRPLIETQDPSVPPIDGPNAHVLLDGWRTLTQRDPSLAQFAAGLFRKNYHLCAGCGYCNWGCKYNRKMSMLESYIPRAQTFAKPARVITNCHAVGIDANGGTATRVRCDRPNGRKLNVTAGRIVVSCGTIGSSVLLMKSGLGRNVGRRVSFNAGTPVFARFPHRIRAFDGVQMAAYVDHREFLLETLFYPPLSFAAALPGWFEKHFQRMRAYDHFACSGVLIGTSPNGHVKESPELRRLFGPVEYRMKIDEDLKRMRRGMARMTEVYFAAGADLVLPATFADVELDRARFGNASIDQIETELARHINKPEDLTLSSAHPQGGNAMSDDPGLGVVDSRFRVHGVNNLYVCDASVFPTSIHINPQLTIMAMADYFANLGEL